VSDAATLSERLEAWLDADELKTISGLCARFGPQSFALAFVVLLALPALPIPTRTETLNFEIVAALLALELLAGRSEVWVPKRWHSTELRVLTSAKGSRVLLKRIRWFERFSRPRFTPVLTSPLAPRVFGLLVLALTAVAFLAPPFTGLDTLPALGVVVLSLGVLLSDAVLAGIGLLIGAAGVALVVGLGHAIVRLL